MLPVENLILRKVEEICAQWDVYRSMAAGSGKSAERVKNIITLATEGRMSLLLNQITAAGDIQLSGEYSISLLAKTSKLINRTLNRTTSLTEEVRNTSITYYSSFVTKRSQIAVSAVGSRIDISILRIDDEEVNSFCVCFIRATAECDEKGRIVVRKRKSSLFPSKPHFIKPETSQHTLISQPPTQQLLSSNYLSDVFQEVIPHSLRLSSSSPSYLRMENIRSTSIDEIVWYSLPDHQKLFKSSLRWIEGFDTIVLVTHLKPQIKSRDGRIEFSTTKVTTAVKTDSTSQIEEVVSGSYESRNINQNESGAENSFHSKRFVRARDAAKVEKAEQQLLSNSDTPLCGTFRKKSRQPHVITPNRSLFVGSYPTEPNRLVVSPSHFLEDYNSIMSPPSREGKINITNRVLTPPPPPPPPPLMQKSEILKTSRTSPIRSKTPPPPSNSRTPYKQRRSSSLSASVSPSRSSRQQKLQSVSDITIQGGEHLISPPRKRSNDERKYSPVRSLRNQQQQRSTTLKEISISADLIEKSNRMNAESNLRITSPQRRQGGGGGGSKTKLSPIHSSNDDPSNSALFCKPLPLPSRCATPAGVPSNSSPLRNVQIVQSDSDLLREGSRSPVPQPAPLTVGPTPRRGSLKHTNPSKRNISKPSVLRRGTSPIVGRVRTRYDGDVTSIKKTPISLMPCNQRSRQLSETDVAVQHKPERKVRVITPTKRRAAERTERWRTESTTDRSLISDSYWGARQGRNGLFTKKASRLLIILGCHPTQIQIGYGNSVCSLQFESISSFLPVDVLLAVFRFVPKEELSACSATSVSWRALCISIAKQHARSLSRPLLPIAASRNVALKHYLSTKPVFLSPHYR